jgi:hypothetical protein
LWIFDPLLCGPDTHGGPFRLQVWNRDDRGELVLVYSGNGPARSAALRAYLVVVDEGKKLRIARDPAWTDFWLTAEEKERVAKDAALARVRELEAELAARSR